MPTDEEILALAARMLAGMDESSWEVALLRLAERLWATQAAYPESTGSAASAAQSAP